jgi:hypothetical protein
LEVGRRKAEAGLILLKVRLSNGKIRQSAALAALESSEELAGNNFLLF